MTDVPDAVAAWSRPLSEVELEGWGRQVGGSLVAAGALPVVLALRGPLGAGKSVVARAVARGAGVGSSMPSPTYNLLFSYSGDGDVRILHLDLYRLEDPDDVWELGWEDLGVGTQMVLIEWPERVESLLPPERWDVFLEFAGPVDAPLRRVRLVRRGGAPDLPSLPGGGGG
jgi:tRNA threonylcarbamoyladenosine biosynthesis protein TsaE